MTTDKPTTAAGEALCEKVMQYLAFARNDAIAAESADKEAQGLRAQADSIRERAENLRRREADYREKARECLEAMRRIEMDARIQRIYGKEVRK